MHSTLQFPFSFCLSSELHSSQINLITAFANQVRSYEVANPPAPLARLRSLSKLAARNAFGGLRKRPHNGILVAHDPRKASHTLSTRTGVLLQYVWSLQLDLYYGSV